MGSPVKSCTGTAGGGRTLNLSVLSVQLLRHPSPSSQIQLDSVSPRDWDKWFFCFTAAHTCINHFRESIFNLTAAKNAPLYDSLLRRNVWHREDSPGYRRRRVCRVSLRGPATEGRFQCYLHRQLCQLSKRP